MPDFPATLNKIPYFRFSIFSDWQSAANSSAASPLQTSSPRIASFLWTAAAPLQSTNLSPLRRPAPSKTPAPSAPINPVAPYRCVRPLNSKQKRPRNIRHQQNLSRFVFHVKKPTKSGPDAAPGSGRSLASSRLATVSPKAPEAPANPLTAAKTSRNIRLRNTQRRRMEVPNGQGSQVQGRRGGL